MKIGELDRGRNVANSLRRMSWRVYPITYSSFCKSQVQNFRYNRRCVKSVEAVYFVGGGWKQVPNTKMKAVVYFMNKGISSPPHSLPFLECSKFEVMVMYIKDSFLSSHLQNLHFSNFFKTTSLSPLVSGNNLPMRGQKGHDVSSNQLR